MSHIPTPEGLPGIRGLFAFRPETALPLNQLVDVLLRGPNSLTPGERETDCDLRSGPKRLLLLPNHPRSGCDGASGWKRRTGPEGQV
jgi:hypothetical protein